MNKTINVHQSYIIHYLDINPLPLPIQNNPSPSLSPNPSPSFKDITLPIDKTSPTTIPHNNNKTFNLSDKDSLLSYLNSEIQITQTDIDEAPIIKIEEESKTPIFTQKPLILNAAGLIGSNHHSKNGITIFGQKNSNSKHKNVSIDYYINYKENFTYPYLFAIYYNAKVKKYYIQAYKGQGTDIKILFIKLNSNISLPIKQIEIISVGNLIFQLCPIKENCLEIWNLSLKNENNSKMVFDPKKKKIVTIGRDTKCNFAYPDRKSFSKIHTTFMYDDKKEEWLMFDGTKTKSSTNGTWVFGIHSFEIKDQMVAEILTSKVKFLFSKSC